MTRPSRRTVESAALFALAFFLTTLLHEAAHAVVALALGRGPTLFTSHVDCAVDGSVADRVWTKAAGPLFSGASGLALLALARSWRSAPARPRLFVAWLAYHGVVNLVGYVFTAWFAPGADVGALARLLGVPTVGQVALMGLGYAGLRLLARPFAPVFAALSPGPLATDDDARAWAHEVALFAGLLATPVILLASLPVPHWLTLMYAAVTALPLLDLTRPMVAARAAAAATPLGPAAPAPFVVAYLVVVAVGRWLLDGGVALAR